MLIAFNKPFNVLCQFTDGDGRRTLADFVTVKNVYPAGRLDYDSEGLLLLTDDGALQQRIADPRRRTKKTYLAQIERVPDAAALALLRRGVKLKDGITAPAGARGSSTSRAGSGRASRPYVFGATCPPRGWRSRSRKAATGRFAA